MKTSVVRLLSLLTATWCTTCAQSMPPEGKGVYLSTDNGHNWQKVSKGLPAAAVINDFAYHKGVYYAATNAYGIYVSKDQLRSWQPAAKGLPDGIKVDAIEGMDDLLVAGSNQHGIFISVNNGASWHAASNGLTNLTVRCLYMYEGAIVAGTNDGIFISRNKGDNWQQVFSGKQVNGITSLHGKLYAGIGKGVLLSADNGRSWQYIHNEYTLHNISSNGEYVYAMCYGPVVLRTKDEGRHWEKADAGFPNLYTFQIQKTGTRLLACQWDGIYKSENCGNRWEKSSKGLPLNAAFTELLVTTDGAIVAAP